MDGVGKVLLLTTGKGDLIHVRVSAPFDSENHILLRAGEVAGPAVSAHFTVIPRAESSSDISAVTPQDIDAVKPRRVGQRGQEGIGFLVPFSLGMTTTCNQNGCQDNTESQCGKMPAR